MTSSSTSPAWRDLGVLEAFAAGRDAATPVWFGRPERSEGRRVAGERIWSEFRDNLAAGAVAAEPPPAPPPDPELTFGEADVARPRACASTSVSRGAWRGSRRRSRPDARGSGQRR
jgi:hypothetical protein